MRQSMKTSPPNGPRGPLAAYLYNITTFLYNIIIQWNPDDEQMEFQNDCMHQKYISKEF